MKRIVPYPLITVILAVMWLLLNQSTSLGHILLGSAVALVALKGVAALQPEPPSIRFSVAMPRLALNVLIDIFRSNLAVGRIILFRRAHRSAFITLPLEMRNRYGLAVLGVIITATPGTLWMQYDSAGSLLLIHVLDLVDEEQSIQIIKRRYERPLMEIFE